MPRVSPAGGLVRLIVSLVVVVLVAWGGLRTYEWFTSRAVKADIEASTAKADRAKALLDEGKIDEARAILEALVASAPSDAAAPQPMMMLARLESESGNAARAIELYERAVSAFPSSPEIPRISLEYARVLREAGRPDDARSLLERVEATAPAEWRAPAVVQLAKLVEDENNVAAWEKARDMYRRALTDAPWRSEAWEAALDGLGRVNVALLFCREPTSESDVYIVEKGDSITLIGNKKNITQGMLTRGNGISETTSLQIGQRLKYTPKDFRIIIERSTCCLFLLDNKGVFKRYFVGLGAPGSETTLGSYKIGNKEKEPTWHKPGEGPIPYGDPRHELGTRWMPLIPTQEGLPRDLGIHGTKRPETVGTFASNGCARLNNDEVEELSDLVVRATPVDIVETVSPDMLAPK